MSATLTWASSGLGAKTGTTVAALFADLNTLITSKAGDATFKWEVASVNSAATPFYLVLKRKDASAGRILLVNWTSTPAANHASLLDQAPTTSSTFGTYFPSGSADTPSNLTAASGTILGTDTNVLKLWGGLAIAQAYAALVQPFYFDSDAGVCFGFQNPASGSSLWFAAAGDLVVDAADAAYAATFSYGPASLQAVGSATSPMSWSSAALVGGAGSAGVRTNYGSANRSYFHAYAPTGAWGNQVVAAADILTDTALANAWFAPVQLLGQTKGEGAVIKLRQLAIGPATTAAFTVYNTTGPIVAAQCVNAATAGGTGFPWLTNFKL